MKAWFDEGTIYVGGGDPWFLLLQVNIDDILHFLELIDSVIGHVMRFGG